MNSNHLATSTGAEITQDQSLRELLKTLPNVPAVYGVRTDGNQLLLIHQRQPAMQVSEHYLPYHQVCIKLGKPHQLTQVIDGRTEVLPAIPGEVSLYSAYLKQSFSWDNEAEFLQLFLAPKLLKQMSVEIYGSDRVELIPPPSSFTDPLILQLGLALKRSLETENAVNQLYAESITHTLAAHLLLQYSTRKTSLSSNQDGLSQGQMQQVTDYIHDNLHCNIRLMELAQMIQMSPYHFSRLFKRSLGISPHQYQIKCRVERTKELLQLQSLAIADIAQIVGFSSQSHLNYHFKRLTGVTPKAFVKR